MDQRKQQVLNTIDSMHDEIVKTVSEVVQIPSIEPKYPGVNYEEVVGGETNANRYLARLYERLGCRVDLWEEEPKRANLVGVWPGTGGGRSLIFNGHIDVVPVGKHEDWKWGNPFSGQVENGRIYGRGSCDMKGPIVAQLMAAEAIKRAGLRLKGDLILESVVGEEVMDHNAGVSATVRRGYRADAGICSEASAPVKTLAIVPVSSGLLWMALTCTGKASHASTRGETFRAGGRGAEVAVNAIDKGVYMVNALRKLEDEWGLTKQHPLFKPGHFTLLPGVITGGPYGVMVPFFISEFCTIEYCIWYHPDEEAEAVKQEVETYIQHAAQLDEWLRHHPPQVEWKLNWPPSKVDPNHPICQVTARAHEEANQGTRFSGPPSTQGFYAGCDAAFLNMEGIPTVIYGPGSLLVAHAVDEYIEIDELLAATKTYALAAMEWCGVA